ncbi:MAG: O-methyltransferase, partial [Actinomycetota bacterium]|nr:O-methyltransferase [Actinomycetota bacterium]
QAYLESLRSERSPVMAEMEEVAERDGVPIVSWETGRLLAVLCRVLDPRVLEVGTAIGYSTLHMAEQLSEGRITSLERDPARASQARGFWEQAGLADRVELVEGDAHETIGGLEGPFDLLFVDAQKADYRRYIELALPLLSGRALVAIDNLLMSGEAGLGEGSETFWSAENLSAARSLNAEMMGGGDWLGVVLSVGDGVGLAVRG